MTRARRPWWLDTTAVMPGSAARRRVVEGVSEPLGWTSAAQRRWLEHVDPDGEAHIGRTEPEGVPDVRLSAAAPILLCNALSSVDIHPQREAS